MARGLKVQLRLLARNSAPFGKMVFSNQICEGLQLAKFQRIHCFSCLALFLLPALGCNYPSESPRENKVQPSESTTGITNQEIEITAVDRAGYDDAIARYRGRVVLVDCWATWCTECTQQFPHTVQISKKYPEESFAVVGLCFDYPDIKEAVAEYLAIQNADFEHLLVKSGASTKSMSEFEISGGLPWYVLYDQQGKVAYRFSDSVVDEPGIEPTDQIEIRIRELLANSSAP